MRAVDFRFVISPEPNMAKGDALTYPKPGRIKERAPSPLQRAAVAVTTAHAQMVEEAESKKGAWQSFVSQTSGLPGAPGEHSTAPLNIHMALQKYVSDIPGGNAYSWAIPEVSPSDELHMSMAEAGFTNTNFGNELDFAYIPSNEAKPGKFNKLMAEAKYPQGRGVVYGSS